MRNGWTAKWFGGRQKHCLTAESLKGQLPKGLTAQRLAGAFVDTDPTVEVGAIVEMDPVAKYPEELLIRSRESLQSRVPREVPENEGAPAPSAKRPVGLDAGAKSSHRPRGRDKRPTRHRCWRPRQDCLRPATPQARRRRRHRRAVGLFCSAPVSILSSSARGEARLDREGWGGIERPTNTK